MTLAPAAWRTVYNVVHALRPPPAGEPAVDVAPAVAASLESAAQARALRRRLLALEIEARLLRAPLRGFCWLPRDERRALLLGMQASRFAFRRRAFARLAALADAPRAAQSRPGA